jgi:hypothetical protein
VSGFRRLAGSRFWSSSNICRSGSRTFERPTPIGGGGQPYRTESGNPQRKHQRSCTRLLGVVPACGTDLAAVPDAVWDVPSFLRIYFLSRRSHTHLGRCGGMRCIFISLCATALLLAPTANAHTAIAVADSSPNGGGEQWAYQFFNPKTPGQHGLFLSRDLSYSEVEHSAIRSCRHKGGIHPKIVVATAKPGFSR